MSRSKKPQKAPARCVFCNSTGVTKEHVWSDWLKSELPSASSHTANPIYIVPTETNGETTAFVVPNMSLHRGAVHQRKIRNVCGKCNNGWMGNAVNTAKPCALKMIRGEKCEVSIESLNGLAAWIAITTIMAEFTDDATRVTPFTERDYLKINSAPPDNWAILIGRYRGDEWKPFSYRHHGIRLIKQPGDIALFAQITTNVIGEFVFTVFSSNYPRFVDEYRTDAKAFEMLTVWPRPASAFQWPQTNLMDDSDMKHVADDFYKRFLMSM